MSEPRRAMTMDRLQFQFYLAYGGGIAAIMLIVAVLGFVPINLGAAGLVLAMLPLAITLGVVGWTIQVVRRWLPGQQKAALIYGAVAAGIALLTLFSGFFGPHFPLAIGLIVWAYRLPQNFFGVIAVIIMAIGILVPFLPLFGAGGLVQAIGIIATVVVGGVRLKRSLGV